MYTPDQGDIVYFNFSPSEGREQKGVRPGLIISRAFFNKASGLALICPITSKKKSYPFEVEIETKEISGVALVDQVRAIDFNARKFRFVAQVTDLIIEEIKARFVTLVQ